MIRNSEPYFSKRYLLNLNTKEIHDLKNETNMCKIDEIKNFEMFDSYDQAVFHSSLFYQVNADGCY